ATRSVRTPRGDPPAGDRSAGRQYDLADRQHLQRAGDPVVRASHDWQRQPDRHHGRGRRLSGRAGRHLRRRSHRPARLPHVERHLRHRLRPDDAADPDPVSDGGAGLLATPGAGLHRGDPGRSRPDRAPGDLPGPGLPDVDVAGPRQRALQHDPPDRRAAGPPAGRGADRRDRPGQPALGQRRDLRRLGGDRRTAAAPRPGDGAGDVRRRAGRVSPGRARRLPLPLRAPGAVLDDHRLLAGRAGRRAALRGDPAGLRQRGLRQRRPARVHLRGAGGRVAGRQPGLCGGGAPPVPERPAVRRLRDPGRLLHRAADDAAVVGHRGGDLRQRQHLRADQPDVDVGDAGAGAGRAPGAGLRRGRSDGRQRAAGRRAGLRLPDGRAGAGGDAGHLRRAQRRPAGRDAAPAIAAGHRAAGGTVRPRGGATL
ncbi:MAG: hypothetical protein AVDCRST_MAG33-2999, partial [uncultured Thermomicrobiales bacterium]